MWPWEHLAFGYLLYSGYMRLNHGRPPGHAPAIALAVATQFPDLVDKPLAWTVDILPTARSLGHSVFIAPLVILALMLLGRRHGVPEMGPAVAIGYSSHLFGDVIYEVTRRLLAREPVSVETVSFLLWPLVRQPGRETPGLFIQTGRLFDAFVSYLGTSAGNVYIAIEMGLLLVAIIYWIMDGRPGVPAPR